MKLQIKKTADKQIGGLRLSNDTYNKIVAIAKREKVSKQVVIRSILDKVIDDVEV